MVSRYDGKLSRPSMTYCVQYVSIGIVLASVNIQLKAQLAWL